MNHWAEESERVSSWKGQYIASHRVQELAAEGARCQNSRDWSREQEEMGTVKREGVEEPSF